ncbi:MAG: cbb3-type cytochrome c oxidase subunit I [Vulcanimicrobiaceae bacterium]
MSTTGNTRGGTWEDTPSVARENGLVLAHVYTSTAALTLGAVFGLLQGFSRANFIVIPSWFDYYRILTAHGVLMALVFTTFFITGLFTFATYRSIPRPERSVRLGWIGWSVMLLGTAMAAGEILAGNATVLYTFYAPLKADPIFYFGATFLIVGTWIVGWDLAENVIYFKRNNPAERIPLPAYGAIVTFVMWVIATLGVVAEMLLVIPWSLGLTQGIDVELTRMLLWYFGHPLVYFWIMCAYLIWYNFLPTTYNGKNFSDSLTRLAFLMLLLLSTPVGLHHQFLEPGISAGWKWLHTFTTYGVALPSFMTAFAIFASFELAARKAGKKGFVQIVRWLPWGNPTFSGCALGMILFLFGGFGGIVNSSYSMDVLVHNTMWIVGHFHVTVGGPAALSFIAAAYTLVPACTGRKLFAPKLAVAQTWTWFIGMAMMSTGMHIAGLLGSPRRTSDVTYFGAAGAQSWHAEMVLAGIGGAILFISVLMFVIVAVGTRVLNRRADERVEFGFAEAMEGTMDTPAALDRIPTWATVAIVLAVLAYAGPIFELMSTPHFLAPGMRTW